jgi:hypothetical protein
VRALLDAAWPAAPENECERIIPAGRRLTVRSRNPRSRGRSTGRPGTPAEAMNLAAACRRGGGGARGHRARAPGACSTAILQPRARHAVVTACGGRRRPAPRRRPA